jgi:hypothetical protein
MKKIIFCYFLLLLVANSFGQNENALHFDGVNDVVNLPVSLNTAVSTTGTLEAWIKTSGAGAGYRAIIVRPGMYGLFLNDNRLMAFNWAGNAPVTVGPLLNDDQWHHVALTYQNGVPNGCQLYLDGQPIGSTFIVHTGSTSWTPNIAYNGNGNSQHFAGNIDNVKLYNRILGASEVLDNYYCLPSSDGLAASYNFNQGIANGNNAGETTLISQTGSHNGTLANFELNGSTSNWVTGYNCTTCPKPTGLIYQYICGGGTIESLVVNGSNIQWYTSSTGGTPLATGTVLTHNVTYYASQTINGCESDERLSVTSDLCENSLHFDGVNDGVLLSSTLNAVSGQTGTAEAWIKTGNAGAGRRAVFINLEVFGIYLENNVLTFFNGHGGTPVGFGPTLNDNQWHHVALTYQNGITDGSQLYLDGQPIGTPFTTNVGNVGSDHCIGYNSGVPLNQCFTGNIDNVKLYNRILTAAEINDSYYCFSVDNNGLLASYNFNQGVAESNNSTETTLISQTGSHNGSILNMALNGSTSNFVNGYNCTACPTPSGSSSQVFCLSATVSDLIAAGTSIQWYSSASGGTPMDELTALSNGTTYYATQTINGCESSNRFAVLVTINSASTNAPTGSTSQLVCPESTLTNLNVVGTAIQWYDVPSGGVPLATNTTITDGNVYYASQTVNACESNDRLAVTVSLISSCDINSLHFDGINDVVNVPTAVHSTITTAGTIEAWIKTSNAGSGYRGIIVREYYYGLFLNNNQLMTYNWSGSGTSGATTYTGVTLNDNAWHHVALTFQLGVTNGTQMFIDGLPVGSPITLFTVAQVRDFRIGNNGTSNNYFQGNIDDVKIWSRALSPQEILNTNNCGNPNQTDLNAFYRFNQGVPEQNNTGSTTLLDESGLDNHATLVNFGLNGTTSNWVYGHDCIAPPCPTPTGDGNQSLCPGSTIADLVADGQNILWYSASSGGTALDPSTLLVSGNIYYATQTTIDCESANRLAVTVTLNTVPSAPTGLTSQTTCGGTLSNLSATGSSIQWYSVETGGTALDPSTPLVNGSTYFASQTVNGCESTDRLAVTVTSETPSPTGDATQEYCDPSTLNSLPANITGSTLQYYSAPTGGSPLSFSTPMVDGTTYYVSQTVNTCESVTRLAVTTTVYTFTSNMSAPSPQEFCNSATVADLDATGTPGATIAWFTNSNGWLFGATPLPSSTQLVNNTTYYAGQSLGTNNLCKYVGTASAQAIINAPETPTGSTSQAFCNSATVNDLTATGTDIQWYDTPTGGAVLSGAIELINGETYYASQTVSGCESTNRLAVTVTINITSTPTGAATQTVCNGSTVADLSSTGSNVQWYDAASGGSPLAISTALINGNSYFASETLNDCESTSRLEVTVVFGIPSAPTGAAVQSFCYSASVADLVAVGSNVQWYANSTGGTTLASGSALSDGISYFASQSSAGCESSDRFEVVVAINSPSAPTGAALQDFCNSATLDDLVATGSNILWYAQSSGGIALSTGTAISNGTYYASQSSNGCESNNRLEVDVTIHSTASPIGDISQTFCGTATLADLTVTGSNITWYDASTGNTSLLTSTVISDGTSYYASQTENGCESENRLEITATIHAIPSAPSGTSLQEFCNNATVGDLTATGSSIQWYSSANGGSALANSTVLSSGSYYASQTENSCESSDRFEVVVTINSPSAPTGAAFQNFCNSATLDDLVATGSNILWYAQSSGGIALSTGTAISNGTYYASQSINGCESNNRLEVDVTIHSTASPIGDISQAFCGTATLADLTVTGSNITWYDASTGNTTLLTSTVISDGTSYYAAQTENGCESVNRLEITATIHAIPSAPSGTSLQEFCNNATVGDLTATGSSIQWYSSANGGSALATESTLTTGSYFATQTINGCTSGDRLEVTVNINLSPDAPTGPAQQYFCAYNTNTIADLNATGSNIQWYTTPTGGSPLQPAINLTQQWYYASQTVNGCESSDRFASYVFILQPDPLTPMYLAQNLSFCPGATVDDLKPDASTWDLNWYLTSSGGSSLDPTTELIDGVTYFGVRVMAGCESIMRYPVTVNIGAIDNTISINGILLSSNQNNATYQWVDCNNNNQPIQFETYQSYNAINEGSYAVIIELPNCLSQSDCITINPLNIAENTISIFRVYPNPTSTIINVELDKSTTIRMFDVTGKLLQEQTGSVFYSLDVTTLSSGIYIIETTEGATAKFVKQ